MVHGSYITIHERYAKLKAFYTQLIPTLTDESWEICASVLSARTLKKGEFLLTEGTVCNYVSFVNKGLLSMYYLVDGKEKIVMFANEMNYISDYRSFLLREPVQVYIQAIEDTEVVETSYDDLQILYKKVPEANRLGRLVAEGLFIEVCKRTDADLKESISQRYNALLKEKPWLLQRVPQYMIASYLGVTPEALSRTKSRAIKKKILATTIY